MNVCLNQSDEGVYKEELIINSVCNFFKGRYDRRAINLGFYLY